MSNIHRAAFPVHLPEWVIGTFSKPDDVVLEPFGGVGTTMIACEKLSRKCRSIEIDPIYVDTAVKRWQDFCQREAVLAGQDITFDELKARGR